MLHNNFMWHKYANTKCIDPTLNLVVSFLKYEYGRIKSTNVSDLYENVSIGSKVVGHTHSQNDIIHKSYLRIKYGQLTKKSSI
jgi:hypothetical protein